MMKARIEEASYQGRSSRGSRRSTMVTLVAAFGASTGCEVVNPGNILDEDLSSEVAFEALVNGMASDLGVGLNGGMRWTGILFGELWESTSGSTEVGRGDLPPDRPEYANWTDPMHSARWVAEDGIRRMSEILGDAAASDANVAEALVWAGFANRLLGNAHCEAVFDGGSPQPRGAYYERAEQQFTEAIEVASAAVAEDLVLAAYGGRAQARLVLGDVSGAILDAQQVPTDFVFEAKYDDIAQGGRQTNVIWHETHPRRNISVAFTWFRDYHLDTADPRVASMDANQPAADGTSPLISVEKYPDGTSDVALVKGSEMRLIEAEGLIRSGQWEDGLAMINQVRGNVTAPGEGRVDLPPWEASNEQEAFQALIRERAIVLWLEARRGGEFYRLNEFSEFFPDGYAPADDLIFLRMVDNARVSLPPGHQLLAGLLVENRATCFTFSQTMYNTNPNLTIPGS